MLTAKLIVSIRTNPRRNAVLVNLPNELGGANITLGDAITGVVHAILAWKPAAPSAERRFELDGEEAVLLATDDPGCLTYDIRFRKLITT